MIFIFFSIKKHKTLQIFIRIVFQQLKDNFLWQIFFIFHYFHTINVRFSIFPSRALFEHLHSALAQTELLEGTIWILIFCVSLVPSITNLNNLVTDQYARNALQFFNRPFYHLFSVFSNKHYNFYNKHMWKMSIQYTLLGFKPTTFSIESPPITTRPGLPSKSITIWAVDWEI